jgi:molecular chaperone DnaK
MFNLTGIPGGKAGSVRVEVNFEIDTDGVLSVSAVDTKTKRSQSIEVTGHSGLSTEEMERASARVSG